MLGDDKGTEPNTLLLFINEFLNPYTAFFSEFARDFLMDGEGETPLHKAAQCYELYGPQMVQLRLDRAVSLLMEPAYLKNNTPKGCLPGDSL